MGRRGSEWEERDQAIGWVVKTLLISGAVTLVLMILSWPVAYMIENGFSKETFDSAIKFITRSLTSPAFLFNRYWGWIKFIFSTKEELKTVHMLPSIPFFLFFMMIFAGLLMNPYGFMSTIHGSGRMAEFNDIKKMGLFDGFIVVLGRWKGRMLMLPETLSVLVCAPPGTGKTVGVVIPTIFNSPGISLIINDPKPELCFKTSGQRIKEGPVFIVNWGAEDEPDNGIYYPSWNALSPSAMPAMGPARDMYVDMMVSVLVEEPKGGADPHWAKTGRNALTGFIHYISNKCERARANDYFIARFYEGVFDAEDKAVLEGYYMDMQDIEAATALDNLRNNNINLDNYVPIGTWELLPEEWVGQEPSIAMILDWLTEAQMAQAADIKKRTEEGDQMAALADPMRDLLDDAVDECRRYGYAHRAIVELNQLSGTPDKERGSILSTALTGIGIFKNSAVRSRTKFSDFTFRDLRGMRDPVTGEWQAISVYMSVNQVDARALNIITGTFVELMSGYLIANPPNFINKTEGKMGPCPTLFVLDEFPQMPKLGAVKDGPAVGRGQKVSYLLIGQDLGQISGQYGKDDLETIISTTAAKIILPQNNEQTAQRFEKMIGTKTVEIESWSRQEGLSQQSNPFSKNVNRSLQGTAVVGASTLLSLPALKQVIIMQGFINRPVMADGPRYYLDKKMLAMSNLPPAPFVPDWIVAQREDSNIDILAELVADDEDDEELQEFEEYDEVVDDDWEEYEEFEEETAVAG